MLAESPFARRPGCGRHLARGQGRARLRLISFSLARCGACSPWNPLRTGFVIHQTSPVRRRLQPARDHHVGSLRHGSNRSLPAASTRCVLPAYLASAAAAAPRLLPGGPARCCTVHGRLFTTATTPDAEANYALHRRRRQVSRSSRRVSPQPPSVADGRRKPPLGQLRRPRKLNLSHSVPIPLPNLRCRVVSMCSPPASGRPIASHQPSFTSAGALVLPSSPAVTFCQIAANQGALARRTSS